MILRAKREHVPNALLYIKDSGAAKYPEIKGPGAVWASRSCIAVGCLHACDGPTEVIIGDAAEAEKMGLTKIFDGTLETPNRVLLIETVLGNKLLSQSVRSDITAVQIWNEGHTDSERIVIGVG